MIKQEQIRNLLLILLWIYFSQGVLYNSGSIISQITLLIVILISLYYLIITLFSKKNKSLFYKSWTALLIINSLGYFVALFDITNYAMYNMYKSILISSLPFYPFYYLTYKEKLTSKNLTYFFLFIFPVVILQFYKKSQEILDESGSDTVNVVNNISYTFVALMPFIFLIKKRKILSIFFMLISIFYVIQGAKRGALISGVFSLIIYSYYLFKTIENDNKIKALKNYLVIFIGIILIIYFAIDYLGQNEALLDRIQDLKNGETSGRDTIYTNIFNAWLDSESFFNLIFGYGYAASLRLSGKGLFAHNDWLELLSNFGLIGVFIYAAIFIACIKYIISSNHGIDKKLIMCAILCSWILSTLFSMSYTSNNGYLKAILLGYLLGNKSKNIV